MQKLNCYRSNILGTWRMISEGIYRPFNLNLAHFFLNLNITKKTGRSKILFDTEALVSIEDIRISRKKENYVKS